MKWILGILGYKRSRILGILDKNTTVFIGYMIDFFSFNNNPKSLDPSQKMDLHLWDFLGRVKLIL